MVVGFAEESMYRDAILQPARREGFSEAQAYGTAITCFGLLHLPNVFLSAEIEASALQMLSTMVIGTGMYCFLRVSKRLWVPATAHGLWDFFAGVAQR